VYEAEWALRDLYDRAAQSGNPVVELDGISLTLPPEARFASVESLQTYVDKVTGMAGEVTVRERRGSSCAHYERGGHVIAIPMGRNRWACREIVVLHELAHHYSRSEHGVGGAHGPHFVNEFVKLLGRVMGVEIGLAYRLLCAHAGAREGVNV
jgi:putative metallohydrolase (TIGR04338 family)